MSSRSLKLPDSSSSTRRSGSATVSGNDVETEIYIRADGKKVRRIKRVVKKGDTSARNVTSSASSDDGGGGAPASPKKALGDFLGTSPGGTKKASSATVSGDYPTRTTTTVKTTSSSSVEGESEIYIRPDGKKVRRIKKPKAGVTGAASLGGVPVSSSSSAAVAATSDSTSTPTAAATTSTTSAAAAPKKSLTSFLDRSGAGTASKKSGSATVTGVPGASSTARNAAATVSADEGEIIIRPDGKKVRRVKRVVTRAKSSSGDDFQAMAQSVSDLKYNAAATVSTSAADAPEGEVYINAEGKKVRRIRKTAASSTTDANGSRGELGSMLNSGKVSSSTGAMTVAGDRPTQSKDEGEIYIRADGKKVRRVKKPKDAAANAASTTPSSTEAAGGLGGFLGGSGSANKTGSATVAGDRVATTTENVETEIYIRPDGKKVRRIKKTVVRAKSDDGAIPSDAPPAATDDAAVSPKKTLANFLGSSAVTTNKKGGSATVTGVPTTSSSKSLFQDSEIYINAEGKKVRRIKKTTAGNSSVAPTPAARAASPSVVSSSSSRAPSPSTPTSASKATTERAGLLSNMLSRSPAKPKAASATVAGDRVSKQPAEGEIYIRADGKKVRRVKKSDAGKAKDASLTGFLGTDESGANKTGSATVAGDQVVLKKTDDGEIIIRADGKKVLRRRKTPAAGAKPEEEGEIYRRADGKLVRRVKRNNNNAAGELAGFLDKKEEGGAKRSTGAATIAGGEKPSPSSLSDLLKQKPGDNKDRSGTPQTAPMSDGSAAGGKDDSVPSFQSPAAAAAAAISKLSKPGEAAKQALRSWVPPPKKEETPVVEPPKAEEKAPEPTLQPKPVVFEETPPPVPSKPVEPTLAPETSTALPPPEQPAEMATPSLSQPKAVVFEETPKPEETTPPLEAPQPLSPSIPEPPKAETTISPQPVVASAAPSASSGTLSEEEEATASRFRKMVKMGMPEEAIRHKMEQEGIEEKIRDAVFAGETSVSAAESGPVAAPTPSVSSLSEEEDAIASKFRKMVKMGMPEDAIRFKMEQEGVDENIMNSVLGGEASVAPAPEPTPLPAAAPESTSALADSIVLSEEEESIASRFQKMVKMGMPEDAIRFKMEQEGVEEKIIKAVLAAEAPPSTPAPALAAATVSAASISQLSDEEEAIASRFRKMVKMGMPEDAIRFKMEQEGVEEKIVNAVLASEAPTAVPLVVPAPMPPPPPPAATAAAPAPAPALSSAPAQVCRPALSEEEQNIVASYRKMVKMGMPPPAVEHKMMQDGADPKLVPYVMSDDAMAPAAQPSSQPVAAPPQAAGGDNSVAYIVVVPDEPQQTPVGIAGAPISSIPEGAIVTDASKLKVHPDEKFAVKVDEEQSNAANTEHGETKYMTLDQIAQLSGQSVAELEAMVTDKRSKAESIPRFVLQPLEKRSAAPLFEVEVPKGGGPPGASGVLAPPVPEGAHLAAVKEGEEVVDAKLADAVRAVTALGDGDMEQLLAKLKAGEMGELIEKLREAEKRQKKLEKQLAQAGVKIAEDIDYSEAKVKVEEIAKRMNEIGGSDVTTEDKDLQTRLREEYFKLEQEMERYNNALMLTDEYQKEQEAAERRWEEENLAENLEALKKLRRHMPVMIRNMSEAELTNNPTPNGKFLPKATAKKFKRTNVLQLLRINPDDIERMHPASLEGMRVTGLTLTERRALYCHLKPVGPKWEKNKSEKMTERKWTWYQMMKNNFKENLAPYKRHIDQYGPPGNHPYATKDNPDGCPLIGKQCPIKADLIIDYNGDYGYTDADEYEVSDVKKSDADDPGAKAMQEALELAREKKANERADLLKKHYKGKLLQVSKANGSCEAMDESMDKMENHTLKWLEFELTKGGPGESEDDKKKEVANFGEALTEFKLVVLDFAQRSGMQVSGKKKAGGDAVDPRSPVECSLSEEVYECWTEFSTWIKNRMKALDIKDTRIEKTIELLEGMLNELHGKNNATLERLGTKRLSRSRKLRTNEDMKKEVEEKCKPKEEPAAEEAGGGPMGLPPGAAAGGRGDMLSAISGRGRGGGGRGGLLDAIAGRGRGRGPGGGRGGLLDAIAGRGKKGPGGGDGGRGGLLAAIAAKGGGGGDGGGDGGGGRGGLLAAIAARGGGGDGGGGRGGLLAAIAARGGGGD